MYAIFFVWVSNGQCWVSTNGDEWAKVSHILADAGSILFVAAVERSRTLETMTLVNAYGMDADDITDFRLPVDANDLERGA